MASSLGAITFGGLASGLPSNIVDQLMETQKVRLAGYERDKEYYTNQKSSFSALATKLKSLSSAAESLQELSSLTPHSASSSNEDEVLVTASSEAQAAFHTINISQLATHNTYVSASGKGPTTDDATITVSGGGPTTFSFDYNGTNHSVSVNDGDTLETIANRINALDDYADGEEGVSASVLYDGSNYRLVLTAQDSGAYSSAGDGSSRIENVTLGADLSFSDGGPDMLTTDSYTRSVEGKDAAFTVDGISVTSSTNTVSDVLTGVTLELQDANSTNVTININNDTDGLQETLQTFIDSYNDVVDYMNQNKSGVFASETSVRSTLSLMRRELNTATTTTGSYSYLSEIGITTDQYTGKLSLDSDKFETAAAADFDAIAEIFAGDESSSSDGLAYRIEDLVDDLTSSSGGIITGKTNSLDSRLDNLDDRILREEERLEAVRVRLTLKFANLEQMISQLNNSANSLTSTLAKM